MDSLNTSPEPSNGFKTTNAGYSWQAQEDITSRVSQLRSDMTPSPDSGTGTSTPSRAPSSTDYVNQTYNYDVPTPIRLPEENPDLVALKADLEGQPKFWDVLESYDKSLQIFRMLLVLEEADVALVNGDADTGEEKIKEGLDIAVKLADKTFIERCEMLMEWAKDIREKGQGAGEWEDVGSDENAEEGGIRRDVGGSSIGLVEDNIEDQDVESNDDENGEAVSTSRGMSTSPGDGPGELLGEYFEGEGLEEAEWQFADNEHGEAGAEEVADLDDEDEDDSHILRGFDPRNRPQTPVPPLSPTSDDDDEELFEHQQSSSLNLKQARRRSTETYNPWNSFTVASQGQNPAQYQYHHEYELVQSSSPTQYSYHDSDSGNEEEDYLDLIPEPDPNSSSDEEEPLCRRITRKRKMPTIADTTLFYTYLHQPNRKFRSKQRFQIGSTATSTDTRSSTSTHAGIATTAKPWHVPAAALDTRHPRSNPDPTLFWHAHSTTLLLRDEPANQILPPDSSNSDISTLNIGSPEVPLPLPPSQSGTASRTMPWLTAYNRTPLPPLSKSKFTFRKRLPVSEMASRVRSTRLFPEQEWEFIPLRADWEAFVREGREKVSMGFLAWERERIADLVAEKRRRWNWKWGFRYRFGSGEGESEGPWVGFDIDWDWITRLDGVGFGLMLMLSVIVLLGFMFYLRS